MMRTTPKTIALHSFGWAALLAPLAVAQTPAPARDPDQAIVLSPFTIQTDKDTGYIASDSLVGGRLSSELIKTPSDVSVLTREFLDDLGATSYLDVANYIAGATVPAPPTGADFGNSVNFRGLGGGFPARNYFRYVNSVDLYIAERVEGARGPNAILFGDGVVGGILNTMTKRANTNRAITRVSTRVDSEGSLRGTVDVNRALSKNFAVRVNLLAQDDRSWVDTFFNERLGAHLAATYRPWANGEFRIEAETGAIEVNYAPQNVSDNANNWNGVPFIGPATANPVGSTGVGRFTTDRLTFGPAYSGVVNLLNFGNTNGSGFAINEPKYSFVPNFNRLQQPSRDFSMQAPRTSTQIDFDVISAFYEHRFTDDLIGEVGFQFASTKRYSDNARWASYNVDINQNLPSGAPNPYFGEIYSDVETNFTQQDNTHSDYRMALAYDLPVTAWKQRFNLIASRRIETFDAQIDRVVRFNNPANRNIQATPNVLFIRQYWRDGPQDYTIPANDAVYQWGLARTRDQLQEQTLDTIQLASTAGFFKDKLNFVGGVRQDFYDSNNRQIGTFNATTGEVATTAVALFETEARKISAGAVYFPIEQIGAYVNYSETFNVIASGDPGLYGPISNQTTGEGYSGGLRFRLFGARVVGSAGYYNTTETGRVSGFGNGEINRIWDNLLKSERRLPSGYRDTSEIKGTGYELDFVANATKNLRIRGNLTFPETEQADANPGLIRYYGENLAEWQAGANNPDLPNRVQIGQDIATLATRIQSGAPGRVLNNTPDYTGSIFGNYTIPSGFFKRVNLGLGGTFIGQAVIGNQVTNSYDYIKSPARAVADASLGYNFRAWNKPFSVQLNVRNLFDYDDPIYTGTRSIGTVAYKNTFYYLEPRKFILSVTVDL